ncbi:hypothetical protein Fmac_008167 [Flemingia macrophylla]|uniref:Secreted peptide n=1 Tax=Flemingia macrophylla TaxID=520843 RepID=A0ABD1MWM0_9FABA
MLLAPLVVVVAVAVTAQLFPLYLVLSLLAHQLLSLYGFSAVHISRNIHPLLTKGRSFVATSTTSTTRVSRQEPLAYSSFC